MRFDSQLSSVPVPASLSLPVFKELLQTPDNSPRARLRKEGESRFEQLQRKGTMLSVFPPQKKPALALLMKKTYFTLKKLLQ